MSNNHSQDLPQCYADIGELWNFSFCDLNFLATGEIEWDLTTEEDSLFKHLL